MVLINKIALLTTICFILISCAVDVNQPVQVEENYVINARDIFDSLVYHIGWKTQNNRFALRVPTDEKSSAIIFLDEINSAAPAVQAAAYQLI